MPRDYIVSYELHGFSDASEKAYGCCLYLKCVTKNNFISTSLVASKSRVAPYKNKITIPRLELLGKLILSRLILTVLYGAPKCFLILNTKNNPNFKIILTFSNNTNFKGRVTRIHISEILYSVIFPKYYSCASLVSKCCAIKTLNLKVKKKSV